MHLSILLIYSQLWFASFPCFFFLLLFGTDHNGCLSTCFPWLGTMSCLGYKTSRVRDVGQGKSAFFSCNVVPKHIWEVGMWIGHACDMQDFIE